jgi:hypothetical protein
MHGIGYKISRYLATDLTRRDAFLNHLSACLFVAFSQCVPKQFLVRVITSRNQSLASLLWWQPQGLWRIQFTVRSVQKFL